MYLYIILWYICILLGFRGESRISILRGREEGGGGRKRSCARAHTLRVRSPKSLTAGVARNSPLAKFMTIGLSAHASSISTSSISQGIGLGLGS